MVRHPALAGHAQVRILPPQRVDQYFTYVLQSLKDHHFYIGHTNNINDRFKRHNEGRVKSTKHRRPWKLVFHKSFEFRSEAVRFERYLKSLKGNNKFREIIGLQARW